MGGDKHTRRVTPARARAMTSIVVMAIFCASPASAQNQIFDFLRDVFEAKRNQGFSQEQLDLLRPPTAAPSVGIEENLADSEEANSLPGEDAILLGDAEASDAQAGQLEETAELPPDE